MQFGALSQKRLNWRLLKSSWVNFNIFCKFFNGLCPSSLKLLQFCMLIHKIQRKKINMHRILFFSKIPRENSNFWTYLGCPHYVWMRKSEKSPGNKIGITIYSWTLCILKTNYRNQWRKSFCTYVYIYNTTWGQYFLPKLKISFEICWILSSFKIMIIFNDTSRKFVLISGAVILKMIIILKELRIAQLCS